MNINRLINSYFLCQEPAPTIEVFDKRADCESQYYDEFIDDDELNKLW